MSLSQTHEISKQFIEQAPDLLVKKWDEGIPVLSFGNKKHDDCPVIPAHLLTVSAHYCV
jgi:hypothetical protein